MTESFSSNTADKDKIVLQMAQRFSSRGDMFPLLASIEAFLFRTSREEGERLREEVERTPGTNDVQSCPYGRWDGGGSSFYERFRIKAVPKYDLHAPLIEKIEILKDTPVRRANKDIIDIYVNAFSFYHPYGPIPSHIVDTIALRIKEKDVAFSDFLISL